MLINTYTQYEFSFADESVASPTQYLVLFDLKWRRHVLVIGTEAGQVPEYLNQRDIHVAIHVHIHVCPCMCTCFNERLEGRKKEASKVKQTNKAKQHSTPKADVRIYMYIWWPGHLILFGVQIHPMNACRDAP